MGRVVERSRGLSGVLGRSEVVSCELGVSGSGLGRAVFSVFTRTRWERVWLRGFGKWVVLGTVVYETGLRDLGRL